MLFLMIKANGETSNEDQIILINFTLLLFFNEVRTFYMIILITHFWNWSKFFL
jgi:hypothetical protein